MKPQKTQTNSLNDFGKKQNKTKTNLEASDSLISNIIKTHGTG